MIPAPDRSVQVRWGRVGGEVIAVVRVLTLLVLLPGTAGAQSLLAGAGLGVPAEPFDATTRALGGIGVGGSGWHVGATDPAAAAGLDLPTITATLQPSRATLSDGRSAGHSRFPTLGIAYPLWGNVFTLTLASVLDQRWSATENFVIDLNGVEVAARDTYRSEGSVGRIQVGWARRVRESFAVGALAGSYVGSVERTFIRSLDPATVGLGVDPFVVQGSWRASGLVLGAGAAWDPMAFLRLSAAVAWADGLAFSPANRFSAEGGRYDMPLEIRIGGTGTLAPGLELSAGVGYADWSEVGSQLDGAPTRGSAWGFGGGVAWSRGALLGRTIPLRIGARHQGLPFLYRGEEATERTLSAGAGLNLIEVEGRPLAAIDFALERGSRSAGDLSETFYRTTVSLRVSGS